MKITFLLLLLLVSLDSFAQNVIDTNQIIVIQYDSMRINKNNQWEKWIVLKNIFIYEFGRNKITWINSQADATPMTITDSCNYSGFKNNSFETGCKLKMNSDGAVVIIHLIELLSHVQLDFTLNNQMVRFDFTGGKHSLE